MNASTTRNSKRALGLVMIVIAAAVLLAVGQTAEAQLVRGHPRVVSGAWGSAQYYFIDVPRHTTRLVFTVSGGWGNSNLYAKRNPPAVGPWIYHSTHPGNNEHISILNPQHGRWWVLVHGAGVFHNASLIADYDVRAGGSMWGRAAVSAGPSLLDLFGRLRSRRSSRRDDDDDDDDDDSPDVRVVTLRPGVQVRNLRSDDDRLDFFRITVPENVTSLTFETSGGRGECLLLVRRDGLPTISANDYCSGEPGTGQAITVRNPLPGVYYARIVGARRYRGVSILADYQRRPAAGPAGGIQILPLENGVPIGNLDGVPGSVRYFMIHLPDRPSSLRFATSGGSGNCVLFVRRNALPTQTEFDYQAALPGTNKAIDLGAGASAGTYYVMLHSPDGYRNVSLLASATR